MTKEICQLVLAKSINPEAPLPEWYLIFPEGTVSYADGEVLTVNEQSFHRVNASFKKRGLDTVVDYEHQTNTDDVAPAAGWIKEWKWDGGIWAKIDWTERAEQYIRSKEYRYFSPAFIRVKDKSGGPSQLQGVLHMALTNFPLTNYLKPLVAKNQQQEKIDVNLLAQLIGITELALGSDATAEQALEAVQAKATSQGEPEQVEIIPKKVLTALGLPEGSDPDIVVAKATSLQNTADNSTQMAARLQELEEKSATRDAEVLLAKHHKKLTPAMLKQKNDDGKPFWLELAKSNPHGFEIVIASMPVQIPDKLPGKTDKGTADPPDLTGEQLVIAKAFNMDPDDFAKGMMEENNG